jgi:hypothetical protein
MGRLVHRLVDEAFRGPRPKGIIVHHRDNDMTNNQIRNLERATYSQNTKYAYRDGLIGLRFKLNPFQRRKVVELYKSGKYRTPQLAEWFRVSKDTISYTLRLAGVKPHGMKKLTPKLYAEIRKKWIPYKYPASRLAKDYGVSEGLIEYILGMRASRRGHWMPRPQEVAGK